MIYGEEDLAAFLTTRETGEPVEIDRGMFYYWLEVLPPVFMNRTLYFDGTPRFCAFGFAEGAEPITAFWIDGGPRGKDDPNPPPERYFCQLTCLQAPTA